MKTASEYFKEACDKFADRSNKNNIYDEPYFVEAIQNAIDDAKKERKIKEVFVLFQTDVWKSKKNRVFLGVFSSKIKAIDSYKKNEFYSNDSEIVILEVNLNEFKEL